VRKKGRPKSNDVAYVFFGVTKTAEEEAPVPQQPQKKARGRYKEYSHLILLEIVKAAVEGRDPVFDDDEAALWAHNVPLSTTTDYINLAMEGIANDADFDISSLFDESKKNDLLSLAQKIYRS
jgi:hypothetical protein